MSILEASTLLGRCWRRMNITTDGHRVRATGWKGWSQIHQDWPTKLCTRARESANVPEYICGMNDHLLRSLGDRYEVIYDWPSPTAMIPRVKPKSMPRSQAHFTGADWARMTTKAASKAATMVTDGLGLRSSRGIGRTRVLAHLEV